MPSPQLGVFLVVKSDERQMNSLPLMFRNHVSFHKIKKSKLLENLNDAYIISMPKFATWKFKMERIIMFTRNRESAF